MKKLTHYVLATVIGSIGPTFALAEESKKEEKAEVAKPESGKPGEKEEEANSAIGPDKGILEKGEQGFKLSPEAIATFGVKFEKASGSRAPESAVAKVKDKKYLYRLKDQWIKRIELSELKAGDEVATAGVGYIRIAELVVVEGLKDD